MISVNPLTGMLFSTTIFIAPTVAALYTGGNLRTNVAEDYEHIKWDDGKCVYWGNEKWLAEATMNNGLDTISVYNRDDSGRIDIDVKERKLNASSPEIGRVYLCKRSSTKCIQPFPGNLKPIEGELKTLTAKTFDDCKRVFKLIFENPPKRHNKGYDWLGEFLEGSIKNVKTLPHIRVLDPSKKTPRQS